MPIIEYIEDSVVNAGITLGALGVAAVVGLIGYEIADINFDISGVRAREAAKIEQLNSAPLELKFESAWNGTAYIVCRDPLTDGKFIVQPKRSINDFKKQIAPTSGCRLEL